MARFSLVTSCDVAGFGWHRCAFHGRFGPGTQRQVTSSITGRPLCHRPVIVVAVIYLCNCSLSFQIFENFKFGNPAAVAGRRILSATLVREPPRPPQADSVGDPAKLASLPDLPPMVGRSPDGVTQGVTFWEPGMNLPEPRRRSSLWNHFTQISGNNSQAKCDLCSHVLSHKSSISNLRKHLLRKHPEIKVQNHQMSKCTVVF